ncbi:hypothetical protein F5Y19DRAFT_351569 [Xylariaceae sp. FL1651]|nr:hypothetical protein F5Y19DRAFT_351569 [Xylariaceae sp. FL1651]
MSHHVRLKIPVAPVKVKNRRGSDSSSSLDLSDESGYSGVEDITDSDDDEEDVEAAEEEHILSDELQHVVRSSPRPDEDEDDDEHEAHDGEDYEGDDDDDAEESVSWDGLPSEPEEVEIDHLSQIQDTAIVQRRVRFDVPDSDDDDTETDEDTAYGFFPDLFVDKSKLDPSFRREVDHNSDDDSDAYWDHYEASANLGALIEEGSSDFEALINAIEDDSTPIATPMTQNDMSTAISTPVASPEKDQVSLDGYQTDGDTTDEEEPPPRPIRRKTRREPVEEVSETSDVEIIKGRRGQPRVGRFSLDRSSKKPIAMVNPRTGKLMIFTTHRSSRRGFDLSPEQFKFPFFDQMQSSPILGNPGNIMMSGMISSNTFGDFMNTHAVGPAEAWYAQAPESNALEDTSGSEAQTVDEEEKNLKIEDFIDIDDDSDSSDNQQETGKDDADDDIFCTPGRPTTASSDVASLLDHFEHNSNLVGAFRRDQAHHQLITRSKATRDSLAFSGPYFEGTLRGIKDGRIATANVPISPLRRRKKVPELTSSPLISLSAKRKASSEHHTGHKRQRSVPDVGPLHI